MNWPLPCWSFLSTFKLESISISISILNWNSTIFKPKYSQIISVLNLGLCLDGGKSLTCRFFKTRAMQFLGRISMSLYLIHEPLIYWIKLIVHGPAEWIDGKNPGLTMPIWAIPIHVLISLVFGTLLTIFLEEPARKFLKNILAKRKEAENIQTAQSQLELP